MGQQGKKLVDMVEGAQFIPQLLTVLLINIGSLILQRAESRTNICEDEVCSLHSMTVQKDSGV